MGTRTFVILTAKKGVKVTGIDNSKKMLDIARKKIFNERLT